MSADARERFIRAIAERLPGQRIEDIRLFAPLKQGGIESGVAVITAVLEVAADAAPRFTIYRAQYKYTLKGAERGKWEVAITEEAEPERLSGESLHAALIDETWTGAR